MDDKLLMQAKELAKLPYSVIITQDEATDGAPILLVENDELKGCMAQGITMDEAIADLADARVDFIYSLLDDGLDIPLPEQTLTVTTGAEVFEETWSGNTTEPAFVDVLEQVTEKENRPAPVRVVLQT
jgi:predicted RNase H-like HicB family nuclease